MNTRQQMQADIIVDCERMKYPNTGLYYFCKYLSEALIEQKPAGHNSPAFYIRPSETGFLPEGTLYYPQKWWHKLYHPIPSNYKVWHGTYQGSNYYPGSSKIKKLLTIHDLNFLYDSNKDAAKKKKYLERTQAMIDRSDQIAVISEFTHQCIREHLDLSNVSVQTIYNGCNTPQENTVFQKPSFITSDTPYIFSIGTVLRKKNFHVLPCLLVGNDYQLIIAGINQDKNYVDEIFAEAKKHGVEDRVLLPGSITENEKWWLLSNMLAMAFPSISEGFGLPVVEAMHFGKPILLSTHTCLPEIGADAAYYFNSFDSEDMQQTFRDALQHFHTHPEMVDKVKKRSAFFSWNKAAKQYWQLYEQLMQNK
ncbi:glycosyltransferase family 1 protein [Lacibacter sp.]|uniref:glycosyltransferase family 4 protein n=1 Tax=Lacibacter sp. TaxID=1915409 RepID=UPI002B4B3ABA|nr:glycosyltransferase family 1 protein [Lacibacter sp.]HLP36648.1 glycosyltransferase family 1 protein [Lacibacter sp.]